MKNTMNFAMAARNNSTTSNRIRAARQLKANSTAKILSLTEGRTSIMAMNYAFAHEKNKNDLQAIRAALDNDASKITELEEAMAELSAALKTLKKLTGNIK